MNLKRFSYALIVASLFIFLPTLCEFICGPGPVTIGGPHGIANKHHFCLANNIKGITIADSDVCLDLNCYTVGDEGIVVKPGCSRIAISSGKIYSEKTPATGSGIDIQGTLENPCFYIRINEVSILGKPLRDFTTPRSGFEHGIHARFMREAHITNCIFDSSINGVTLELCSNTGLQQCSAKSMSLRGFWLSECANININQCNAFEIRGAGDVFGFISENGIGNTITECSTSAIETLATTSEHKAAGFLFNIEHASNLQECIANTTFAAEQAQAYGVEASESLNKVCGTASSSNLGTDATAVSWLPSGYLAVCGGGVPRNAYINIYLLDPQKAVCHESDSITPLDMDLPYSLQWFNGSQKTYLAIGGQGLKTIGELIIYQFDPSTGKLNPTPTDSFPLSESLSSLSWLSVGNTHYLAIGAWESFSIYSFDPETGKLNHTPTDTKTLAIESGGVLLDWLASPTPYIACISTYSGKLQIYSFNVNRGKLSRSPTDEVETTINNQAYCLQFLKEAEPYLAAGGINSDYNGIVKVYKFDAASGKLQIPPITIEEKDSRVRSLSWLTNAKTYLSTISGYPGSNPFSTEVRLHTYNLNSNGTLTFNVDLQTRIDGIGWSCSWLAGERSFIAVSGRSAPPKYAGDLYVYELKESSGCTIQYNQVYATKGPQAVGISGNDIKNMIIRNIAYNNTINYNPSMKYIHIGYGEPINPLYNIALQ